METILTITETENMDNEEYSGKMGFVVKTSEQTIKIYIENGQSCCEDFGYFVSEDNLEEFIGADLIHMTMTDTCLNTTVMEEHVGEYGLDGGGIMFVNLETSEGTLQFAAYNSHNGYYGHAAGVVSKTLNHNECL